MCLVQFRTHSDTFILGGFAKYYGATDNGQHKSLLDPGASFSLIVSQSSSSSFIRARLAPRPRKCSYESVII